MSGRTGINPSADSVSGTSNRLNSITGALSRSYTYDAVGNTVSDGLLTLTHNVRNRLAVAQNGSNTRSYVYDALGQLMEASGTGGITRYVYDLDGRLIGEYDGTGALIQETVWLGDIPVASVRPGATGGIGLFYVHADQLNTPRKLVEPSNNATVWRWESDPFGNGLPDQDPDGNGLRVNYNLRFPGQVYDSFTGLSYNYFRDYDPATGRYVESDPIGLRGGINTYSYAGLNPLSNQDPSGLAISDVVGSFQAGVVAGVGGQYLGITLRSPCSSDGKRYTITVHASGASAGLGLKCKQCFTSPHKLAMSGRFDDRSPQPNPLAFDGPYLNVSYGGQILGFGGEWGDTVLGHAISVGGFTPSLGFGNIGLEAVGTIGTSTVTSIKTETCSSCERPK